MMPWRVALDPALVGLVIEDKLSKVVMWNLFRFPKELFEAIWVVHEVDACYLYLSFFLCATLVYYVLFIIAL